MIEFNLRYKHMFLVYTEKADRNYYAKQAFLDLRKSIILYLQKIKKVFRPRTI